ncbi:MAG: GNAT family N-acetyltransferase [Planctomycetota bacterium]
MKDFPAILEISNWAACHTSASFRTEPQSLQHWIDLWKGKAEHFPWLVADRDGAVVGFAMASPFLDRCGSSHVAEVTVYVHPDHLGQGVGHALYRRLLPTLEAQGFRAIVAVITSPNPSSEALHRRFGFTKTGRLFRAGWKFGKWYDVAYWELLFGAANEPPPQIRSVQEVEMDGVVPFTQSDARNDNLCTKIRRKCT